MNKETKTYINLSLATILGILFTLVLIFYIPSNLRSLILSFLFVVILILLFEFNITPRTDDTFNNTKRIIRFVFIVLIILLLSTIIEFIY